ncbi:MAG: hypothetical protein HWN67_10435 [Candidatus Helarchaeota archaeon]|nr:hypothetical protein [Candidatus Helarchaeota archaeon]
MSLDIDEVILRTYPKIIFFWPTALASAILGLLAQFIPLMNVPPIDLLYQLTVANGLAVDLKIILGIIWFANFAGNLFIVSFEYNSAKVVALVLAVVVGVLGAILVMAYIPDVGQGLPKFSINDFPLTMSWAFYYSIAGLFGFVFAFIWIEKRWDYYKITSQDIVHKSGIFGDLERYPAPNIHIHKRISDVFEYLLLKSGELTIIPAQRTSVIHLPNVLNINEKEKHIHEILGTLAVEVDNHAE